MYDFLKISFEQSACKITKSHFVDGKFGKESAKPNTNKHIKHWEEYIKLSSAGYLNKTNGGMDVNCSVLPKHYPTQDD